MKIDPDPQQDETGQDTQFVKLRSKYEFVMAAAKEAERLNDFYRNRGITPEDKVTVEAIRRVRHGITKVAYEEPHGSQEEPRKESTYFFGT